MTSETHRARSVFVVVFAAIYAVVIATGTLVLVLVVAAAVRGDRLIDLYANAFPHLRGSGGSTPAPLLGYAILFAYVLFASIVATTCRRRLAKRWK